MTQNGKLTWKVEMTKNIKMIKDTNISIKNGQRN